MASKKKSPTLPEQLRQLADAIEEVTKPKRPQTFEEKIAALHEPGAFRRRLLARRARLAAQDESDDEGGGNEGAPNSPPLPPKPRRRFR